MTATATTSAGPADAASHPTDEPLLARVLRCYKPHCRYLLTMAVGVTGGAVRGSGTLSIAESCYIDDTGHLNSVEVNICYNQMLYYVIAKSVKERLEPVFAGWTMEDFWRRQLPDILIYRLTSTFRSPIDRRHFFAEFEVRQATQRRLRPARPPMISLDTTFRCWTTMVDSRTARSRWGSSSRDKQPGGTRDVPP